MTCRIRAAQPPAQRPRSFLPAIAAAALALALLAGCATTSHPPAAPAPDLWVDLVRGEKVPAAAVLADLAAAGVVYMGETHTVRGHHEVQLQVMQELFARKVPLVLCLEQLEAPDQPVLDRYNRRELDYEALVKEIDWPKQWRNYADYRQLCEFAQHHRIPIRALNAPAEIIRAVYRGGGVAALHAEQRAQLPAEVQVDDPAYERLMQLELAVHAAVDATTLRPMFEAQVARDEAMAANILAARQVDATSPRLALVILGAGHLRFGLGTAARVRRRDPQVSERLVLITVNEPVTLSAAEQAASREVTISHASLRELGRPPADYLRVLPPRIAPTLPPGHPPLPR